MTQWTYKGTPIDSTDVIALLTGRAAQSVYGFIYMLYFADNLAYIGKKNLWITKELEPLKSGAARQGHIRYVKHRVNGQITTFEAVQHETNWLNYRGSSKETVGRVPLQREILEFCFSKRRLTYREF